MGKKKKRAKGPDTATKLPISVYCAELKKLTGFKLIFDWICSYSTHKMSFEVVEIGTCQGLFNDGRRVHTEPRTA